MASVRARCGNSGLLPTMSMRGSQPTSRHTWLIGMKANSGSRRCTQRSAHPNRSISGCSRCTRALSLKRRQEQVCSMRAGRAHRDQEREAQPPQNGRTGISGLGKQCHQQPAVCCPHLWLVHALSPVPKAMRNCTSCGSNPNSCSKRQRHGRNQAEQTIRAAISTGTGPQRPPPEPPSALLLARSGRQAAPAAPHIQLAPAPPPHPEEQQVVAVGGGAALHLVIDLLACGAVRNGRWVRLGAQ